MKKKKIVKVWKRVFGYEKGDRIKVVDVFDKFLNPKDWIGRKGKILDIVSCYCLNEERVLYFIPSKDEEEEIKCYRVLLDGTSTKPERILFLVDSDMEYIGDEEE